MVIGHIYLVDLKRVHPSYVAALQEFLSLFGKKNGVLSGFATEVTKDMMLHVAVKNSYLDEMINRVFLKKCGAGLFVRAKHESAIVFPDEPFIGILDANPGEATRQELDPEAVEKLEQSIDEAKGRA